MVDVESIRFFKGRVLNEYGAIVPLLCSSAGNVHDSIRRRCCLRDASLVASSRACRLDGSKWEGS